MNVFGNISAMAKSLMSEWVKIGDSESEITIEHFDKKPVDESKTNGHCWKCVTVNQCWFKNEEGKKPKEFDYSKYSFSQIPLSKRSGLYHPNCHDKKYGINVPKLNDIEILDIFEKFDDFFIKKKFAFLRDWNFRRSDKIKFIQDRVNDFKNLYRQGNYEIYLHWQMGFQITIKTTFSTKNIKMPIGEMYSGFIVYPNGKLRLITVYGGKNKINHEYKKEILENEI